MPHSEGESWARLSASSARVPLPRPAGATKNATPTPLRIVSCGYTQATPTPFDKLRMQGIAHPTARCGPDRRGALPRRGGKPPGGAAPPFEAPGQKQARSAGRARVRALRAERTAAARAVKPTTWATGMAGSCSCVHADGGGRGRARALASSLSSTHPSYKEERRAVLLTIRGARDTFPVLRDRKPQQDASAPRWSGEATAPGTPTERVAAGLLLRHTAFEEALLLHVLALSDERAQGDRRGRPPASPRDRWRARAPRRQPAEGAACTGADAVPNVKPPRGVTRGRGRRRHLPFWRQGCGCASARRHQPLRPAGERATCATGVVTSATSYEEGKLCFE